MVTLFGNGVLAPSLIQMRTKKHHLKQSER